MRFFPYKGFLAGSDLQLEKSTYSGFCGLWVCPERDEGHLEEAHFTAQAQCFCDFGTSLGYYVPGQISGTIGRKNEPLRTSCVSAFSHFFYFLPSLECSYVISPQPCALLHSVCTLK